MIVNPNFEPAGLVKKLNRKISLFLNMNLFVLLFFDLDNKFVDII